MILREYLAGLKLQAGEKEELLLPHEDPPAGFDCTYNRCCRRTLYPDGDFTIVRSNEMIYRMDEKDQDNVETVCITLKVQFAFLVNLTMEVIVINSRIVVFLARH